MSENYRIGLIGKGALGLLYAPMAQKALGHDNVCFIMDDQRYERHRADVYTVNGANVTVRDLRATEAAKESPFDLLLIAVKSTGLKDAINLAKHLVGKDTLVIPLLNGITSEEKCAAEFGWEHVIGCVSYGMDASRIGTELTYSNAGELQLGLASTETPVNLLEKAVSVLKEATIPVSITNEFKYRLWCKFIANVGLNQVCAAYSLNYQQLFSDQTSDAFRTYVGAMREVLACGNAEGVPINETDMNAYVDVALHLDPHSFPSMAQDRVNKNKTEVDEFSGEIIRIAEKHGIWVPCNRYLNKAIHEFESNY